MLTVYVLVIALAGLLAAVNCVIPAVILAGVAAGIVFRHEVMCWVRSTHGSAPSRGL